MTDPKADVPGPVPAGLQCPDCGGPLSVEDRGGECLGCRRRVALRGGRILDFLECGAVAGDEPLRWPRGTLERVGEPVRALRERQPLAPEMVDELVSLGLSRNGTDLTDLGDELSYDLTEYQRQAGEPLLGGWYEQTSLGAGSRVLDIGCGAGQTLRLMARLGPAECVGVDINLAPLALGCAFDAEASPPIRFVRASAHALPFVDEAFTHVVCRVGLNYMHQARALREMIRVLQPGGYLFCRVEGPGFDLALLRAAGSARERLSRLVDFALGAGHHLSGRQPMPGSRLGGGRTFGTMRRLARILEGVDCRIVQSSVLGRGPAGLPTGYELLARRSSARLPVPAHATAKILETHYARPTG